MKLVLIAALTRRRVIGAGGRIPWHLSEDLKRFKRGTTGHTVLMGRKTFESIGKLLPNRRNVVLSSRPVPGVETYASLDEALASLKDESQVFVIGGGTLYAQTLERAMHRHAHAAFARAGHLGDLAIAKTLGPKQNRFALR